jgi:hypothetical protein
MNLGRHVISFDTSQKLVLVPKGHKKIAGVERERNPRLLSDCASGTKSCVKTNDVRSRNTAIFTER